MRAVAPFNINWTIRELGTHTFHVVAVDAAGNVTKGDPVTVRAVPRQEEQ